MPKRTIHDMINDAYEDDEVRAFISKDVEERKTADKIVRGELVLPSPQDAERNYLVSVGKLSPTGEQPDPNERIAALEQRLKQLEALGKPPQPEHKG
jgi:hypothetical protein